MRRWQGSGQCARWPTGWLPDKLAETVEKTFYETDPATLEKCFQTKTRVLSSILSVDGGNKYPLPRSGR